MSMQTIEVLSLWRGRVRIRPTGSMRELATEICELYDIDLDGLKGRSQARRYSNPRQHFMARAYGMGHLSLCQVGDFLGGRDHATVKHGIEAHKRREAKMAAEMLAERLLLQSIRDDSDGMWLDFT